MVMNVPWGGLEQLNVDTLNVTLPGASEPPDRPRRATKTTATTMATTTSPPTNRRIGLIPALGEVAAVGATDGNGVADVFCGRCGTPISGVPPSSLIGSGPRRPTQNAEAVVFRRRRTHCDHLCS